jgi:hypothetical protein
MSGLVSATVTCMDGHRFARVLAQIQVCSLAVMCPVTAGPDRFCEPSPVSFPIAGTPYNSAGFLNPSVRTALRPRILLWQAHSRTQAD